ncbi:MAG: T9SS type A sorting domain-containing protein [Saprospiraceae bacterium]|nr:T9SS type A sorting domain-containing protein [Saprospiraceae bacterium]
MSIYHLNKQFFLLLTVLFCYQSQIQAQDYYPSEKALKNSPEWVQEMFSSNPNIWKTRALKEQYDRAHNFEKTSYSQYFKHWWRRYRDLADQEGYIKLPTPEQMAIQRQRYIAKQGTPKSTTSTWQLLGPSRVYDNSGQKIGRQTNVRSINIAASNPNILYCGTEPGELYKSVDAGETWSNVSYNVSTYRAITAIAIDPSNPNIAYAGGEEGRLLKTTDGGGSWSDIYNTNWNQIHEILIDPSNPQILFMASSSGLYKSSDSGANWSLVISGIVYDIEFKPNNSTIVYALRNNVSQVRCDFYKSINNGDNWTIQNTGWYNSNDPNRTSLGGRLSVSLANPNRVYAYLIGNAKADDNGFIGLFRSDDEGASWSLPGGQVGGPYDNIHPNLASNSGNENGFHQGLYNCALIVNPNNADQVLVGGSNLWRSTDGGATFVAQAGYIANNLNIHVDQQDFRALGSTTWIANDGGIYKSNDFFSNNSESKMSGVHGAEFWGFGSGWNEDVLVGGLYHNGVAVRHENYPDKDFLSIAGGEPPTGYVNPSDNKLIYSSYPGIARIPNTITGNIAYLGNMGMSPYERPWAAESSELEFDPRCYNHAYLGNDHQLWKTTDGGLSFALIHSFGNNPDMDLSKIEVSRQNPDVIYVCQSRWYGVSSPTKLWKTTDGGQTWIELNMPFAANQRLMLITSDPRDANTLWLAFSSTSQLWFSNNNDGNRVFKTTDGGQTWTNLTTPTLDGESCHDLVHIGGTDGGVYYCSQNAIFYRNNTMSDWVLDNSGLPLVISTNIAKPFYRDGKIRIATYGKSIWESPLHEAPSQPIAQIMVDKLEQNIYQACPTDSFYFDDYSMLNYAGASWSWTFENGSPASSSIRNPSVLFSSTGTHLVTLTVTDANGVSDIDSLYIRVNNATPPTFVAEDFESSSMSFTIVNYDDDLTWEINTDDNGGYGLSQNAVVINNYYGTANTSDDLNTFADLSNASEAWLYFDLAYAKYSNTYIDTLEVLISTDCGQTFSSIYEQTGHDLATAPNNNSPFVPAANEWRTDSLSLDNFIGQEILLTIRNKCGYGNQLWLDNINVSSLSIPSSSIITATEVPDQWLVYPNPVKRCNTIQIQTNSLETLRFELYDNRGRMMLNQEVQKLDRILVPRRLSPGIYFYRIEGKHKMYQGKISVQ